MEYCALIRTFNSRNTIQRTIASLACQSHPPVEYIVIDSGSTDGTLDVLPPTAIVHTFSGSVFNYSEALNQGIAYITTEAVLIISSHTSLMNSNSMEYALALLANEDRVGAAYFSDEIGGSHSSTIIDTSQFNGFNGLWNTCAVIRADLLRQRPFRAEVFAAEDQEWASWLLNTKKMVTARISGGGMRNDNPRRYSIRKRLNDYVSVAIYAKPDLLHLRNLIRIASCTIHPKHGVKLHERWFHFLLLLRLLQCKFTIPKMESRYY